MVAEIKTPDRIPMIDILRGFTLFGIIMVHFVEEYYAGMPPQKAANYNTHHLADQIASGFINFFVSGKFYMIFSFLFGLSFFIQFSRSEGKVRFQIRFLWRLVVLFAIGWLHHLHYRGDILTIYALLGSVLLIFHRLPDKLLLIVALALIINLPAFIQRGVQAARAAQNEKTAASAEEDENEKANEIYYDTLKSGSYFDILKANAHEFKSKMDFQIMSGRLYITMGLFLLGLYTGRKKIFEHIQDYLPFFKKIRKGSLWGMLGLILFALAFFGATQLFKIHLSDEVQWMVGGFIYDLFNLCQAVFYVSIIVLLYQKEKWKARLQIFYEAGRMGLTTYLTQTLFGIFIFFGIGFNLLNVIGASLSLAIAVCLFILQMIIAKWWLARFQFGPVEWLWRSLTYLKWQPLIK